MQQPSQNTLYPVFLKLEKLNVLIVGGGEVGAEKLRYMLKSSPDANIMLVAETINDEITELLQENKAVKLQLRSYQTSDLEGINIAIIATDNKSLNTIIREEAKQKNILVNVADTPELCDFYLGSIVTKGDLKIAISTNGKSPTFAKRLREFMEENLPDSIPELLNNLHVFRNKLKGDFKNKVKTLNELTEELTAK
ncbi:MAG: Siroheme synthase [Bacteroidia bacterium]|nr:Siroheme synthase [Bacteroidia bacterium]